jgi:hypothetical protein
MLAEVHHKLGVFVTDDKLWHPMMPNPHIEKQLSQVKSYNCFSWSHFCQLGESIDYHKDGIHSIPFR